MTDTFTYIVIDDESKAIILLNRLISQYFPNLKMIDSCTAWDDGFRILKKDEADLVFIDILMPHKTGLDLLKLTPQINAEIIFVTAYEEHALEAFNFAPSGYLLKPIDDARLISVVEKTIRRVHHKKIAEGFNAEKNERQKRKICIHNNKGVDYVAIDDVLYFEATFRCTKVVTKNKAYLSSSNLGKFKELLADFNFYTVHRSYIVNIDRIIRYENSRTIIFENGDEIPVSKDIREGFLKIFNMV
jgi:two-component system LytT family response regulator